MNSADIDITQEEKQLLDLLEEDRFSDVRLTTLDNNGETGKTMRKLWRTELVMAEDSDDVDVETQLRKMHDRLSPQDTDTGRKARNIKMWRWVAVAAVTIACIAGAIIYFGKGDNDGLGDTRQVMAMQMPDNTTLMMRDGDKWVPMDKAHNDNGNVSAADYKAQALSMLVPKGKTSKVRLADGTTVLMNPGSRMVFPSSFKGKERVVELDGEALFNVRHDPSHPFIVKTTRLTTKVLGTKFNVSAEKGIVPSVTLISGKVEVTDNQSKQKALLAPGQCVMLDKGGLTIAEVDVSQYEYRARGMFYFDDMTLENIMDCLSRWYGIKISITNKQIAKERFHISAEQGSLDSVINQLNSLEEFSIHKFQGKLLVW